MRPSLASLRYSPSIALKLDLETIRPCALGNGLRIRITVLSTTSIAPQIVSYVLLELTLMSTGRDPRQGSQRMPIVVEDEEEYLERKRHESLAYSQRCMSFRSSFAVVLALISIL